MDFFFLVLAWLPKRPIFGRNRNLKGSPCLLSIYSLAKISNYILSKIYWKNVKNARQWMNKTDNFPFCENFLGQQKPANNSSSNRWLRNFFLYSQWLRSIRHTTRFLLTLLSKLRYSIQTCISEMLQLDHVSILEYP